MAQEITLARVVQAGVVPRDAAAIVAEIQHIWNRDDAMEWASLWGGVFTEYGLLMESHQQAQNRVSNQALLDAQRS
ncbi:hypothetical protein E2L00_13285 [Cedecea colo]|uniref:Uncharacterized protein n=1 Tax=Cedecea colo TaxID=2552946 RepID=A0ABX0VQB9_9ENTR|nr:hypothetical protein [Cedecea colo]